MKCEAGQSVLVFKSKALSQTHGTSSIPTFPSQSAPSHVRVLFLRPFNVFPSTFVDDATHAPQPDQSPNTKNTVKCFQEQFQIIIYLLVYPNRELHLGILKFDIYILTMQPKHAWYLMQKYIFLKIRKQLRKIV